MSDFGIVCELNPLHLGHRYLIQAAKDRGAQRVVCAMSGNSVQRGDLAVFDKYLRAECAVRAGADLVLELPYPWCSASAETFALGGISVLSRFADVVFFGSECGNAQLLNEAAARTNESDFRNRYRLLLKTGAPAAAAYAQMLAECGCSEIGPNDLLGIEYLRAADSLGSKLCFQTVKREGAVHRQKEILPKRFPSSSAIRKLWRDGRFETAEPFLPPECATVYRRAVENGDLISEKQWETLVLSWFRLHRSTDFEGIFGTEGGLAARFCSRAREASSAADFYDRIRTKRYTDAHLHRVLLYCLTGATSDIFQTLPQYTTVLAANEKGRALLSEKRKNSDFSVVTKGADAPKHTLQYDVGERLDTLFSLATERRREASAMLKKKPYMA